jgi:hypothetical protein
MACFGVLNDLRDFISFKLIRILLFNNVLHFPERLRFDDFFSMFFKDSQYFLFDFSTVFDVFTD